MKNTINSILKLLTSFLIFTFTILSHSFAQTKAHQAQNHAKAQQPSSSKQKVKSNQKIQSSNSSVTSAQDVTNVLLKYNESIGVKSEVSILTKKKVLGSKTVNTGEFLYEKNKLFLGLDGDKKTDFIYDGKVGTLVNYPDQELDPNGKRKILKLELNKNSSISPFLNIFTDPSNFLKKFEIKSVENIKENLSSYSLIDKSKKIKNVKLVINNELKQLAQFSYTDDVETDTAIDFKNTQFDVKIDKTKFIYKKLSTDEEISQ